MPPVPATPAWLILAPAVVLAWAVFCRWLLDAPRADPATAIAWRFLQLYAALWHRLRVHGRRFALVDPGARPLIVVANHTAGVDPLLVQSQVPLYIRWMMARDMMVERHEALWEWAQVIPVERRSRDTTSARQAIAHLRRGGVLGVFPEGGIERPPRQIRTFMPGIGLLVARTNALVLPVVIDGTPQADSAWGSLITRGRAVLHFHEPIDYTGRPAAEITRDLERRYLDWTRWPLNPGDVGEDAGE